MGYWPFEVNDPSADLSDSHVDAVVHDAVYLSSGGRFGVYILIIFIIFIFCLLYLRVVIELIHFCRERINFLGPMSI